MKRAVQTVTLIAIALWLGCFGAVQAAIWNEGARDAWTAEAFVVGGFALVLSILSAIGWGILPPPEPPEG